MMAYKPYDVELLGLDLYLKCYIANNFFPPCLSENNVDVYVYKVYMDTSYKYYTRIHKTKFQIFPS